MKSFTVISVEGCIQLHWKDCTLSRGALSWALFHVMIGMSS